jgi:signal transduction histidine kinase
LKFSKPDVPPRITVTHEIVKGSRIKAPHVDPNKPFHHIAIADNGIGFELEHRQKIFEVFQRLHGRSEYSGTGIGLAICKKIVDNHRGFIQADSEVGRGATFHIYIPVPKNKPI